MHLLLVASCYYKNICLTLQLGAPKLVCPMCLIQFFFKRPSPLPGYSLFGITVAARSESEGGRHQKCCPHDVSPISLALLFIYMAQEMLSGRMKLTSVCILWEDSRYTSASAQAVELEALKYSKKLDKRTLGLSFSTKRGTDFVA